jgi:hypothetical protein
MRTATLSFLILLSSAARAQLEVYERFGQAAGDGFGSAVVTIDDLDGDGVSDLLVGAPRTDHAGSNSGSVHVLSGANGTELYRVDGISTSELFGSSLAALADLDGDGLSDWIAGAPFASPGAPKVGRADVCSGADGAVLFSISGIEQFSLLGTAVAGAGDANGDGVPDVVVCAPHEDANGTDAGNVYVYSGLDGTFIRNHPGDSAGDLLGQLALDLGDVDGDGIGDYAAGTDRGAGFLGQLRVYSGATGAVLYTKLGASTLDDFAWSAARIDDLDGDGRADILVGAPADATNGFEAGAAFVYSGSSGAMIRSIFGGLSDELGWSSGDAGDWDGDGTGDLILAARGPSALGDVRVFSGTDSSLLTQIIADSTHQDFGTGLTGRLDIDGDGRSELAIGDGLADGGASDTGSLVVYSIHSLLGTSYCLGDGSGMICPCGNLSFAGGGCANSSMAGALLSASGSASVSTDDLTLSVTGAIPGQAALLFVGTLQQNGGLGSLLGDGLLCAGGTIQRLNVEIPDSGGGATWGPELSGAAGWSAGQTRQVQVWYRDTVGGPCSSGNNLSQGLELQLQP